MMLLLGAVVTGFILIAALLIFLRPKQSDDKADAVLIDIQAQLKEASIRLENIRLENVALEKQVEFLDAQLEERRGIAESLQKEKEQLVQESQGLSEEIVRLQSSLREERNLNSERQRHLEELQQKQKDDQVKLQEAMNSQFKNMAQEILEKNSSDLQKRSTKDLEQVLNPLKDQLGSFNKLVNETNKEAAVRNQDLKNELKTINDTALRMSKEASDLTNSLKGQSQVRGAWGEMVLEHSLESSGLRKGYEYTTQDSFTGEDGQRLRPDAIVKLPGNRCIIIDSKLSLIDYNAYINAEDETEKQNHLAAHVTAVKTHIKQLSSKSYQEIEGLQSPDFVVMFVPLESALMLALEQEPQMAENALQQNIGIASPSTIMMVLRTIEHLWRTERQIENAEEISKRGAALYDKFRGFTEDLSDIRAQLGKAQDSVEKGFNKLSTGRGNLVSQAEKLRDLGVKVKKPLAFSAENEEELPQIEEKQDQLL
ncbi:DNA recombination protein RmuC [Curvivirga sp.]|uniref:DNA recombination protein RmuC n=1 Tax=Curvivirga sp. TaxID=2856848 RepID=UPI003B5C9F92